MRELLMSSSHHLLLFHHPASHWISYIIDKAVTHSTHPIHYIEYSIYNNMPLGYQLYITLYDNKIHAEMTG